MVRYAGGYRLKGTGGEQTASQRSPNHFEMTSLGGTRLLSIMELADELDKLAGTAEVGKDRPRCLSVHCIKGLGEADEDSDIQFVFDLFDFIEL